MKFALPILAFTTLALLAGNPPRVTKQEKYERTFDGHQIVLYLADQKGVDHE